MKREIVFLLWVSVLFALGQAASAASDHAAGSTALFGATDFMRRGSVDVQQCDWPDLEAVLNAMYTDALLASVPRLR